VFQTGAWIHPDERPLAPELEAFLDAGKPPLYFGFGSIRAPEGLGRAMNFRWGRCNARDLKLAVGSVRSSNLYGDIR